MNFKRYFIPSMLSIAMAAGLCSCLGDNDDSSFDVKAWTNQNETYFLRAQDSVDANGNKVFEKIEPSWAPGVYALAKWHNDRSLTASNLSPMDNSTCEIKYDGSYINGVRFDSSYAKVDSVVLFKPTELIVGFHAVLTEMHVGDSVTCVIPSNAGYGASSSSIRPYSTLIFNIKLKSIPKYELPNK